MSNLELVDEPNEPGQLSQVRNLTHLTSHLYQARRWIKASAIFIFANGVPFALTIIGLMIAWLPFWSGVAFWQSANAFEKAYWLNDKNAFEAGHRSLKRGFKLLGIYALIFLVLIIISAVYEETW